MVRRFSPKQTMPPVWNNQNCWHLKLYIKDKWVTPLVVTFHLDLPHLSVIVHECQCMIGVFQRLQGTLLKPPLVVHHCLPRVRNLLVRSALKNSWRSYKLNNWSNQPWRKFSVFIAKMVLLFITPQTRRSFFVKVNTDCQTKNVVYLIECTKCTIQCIEETKNMLWVH